ncbi:MAG: ABC transporter permease, partial [Chloroflexota bacterium]|nr:ABC transporter permease [Chloroflexota bacterium]
MKALTIFILRKFARLLILLAAVSVFSFALLSLSPIDPVDAYIGADMTRISSAQRELIAQRWGLNEPPVTRYLRWLRQAVQGNLGTSMIFN